jgi:hypothetical protein
MTGRAYLLSRRSEIADNQYFNGIVNHPDGGRNVEQFIGQDVVIDVESQYVFLGRLDVVKPGWLRLTQADVHDLRDSKTTRELYVLDSRTDGIRINRREVVVPTDQIVSMSLLEDVIA